MAQQGFAGIRAAWNFVIGREDNPLDCINLIVFCGHAR